MSVILLDPAAEGVPDFLPIADRLKELNGKRIGLLDNIKHNAEYLLAAVGTRLEEMGCEVKAVRKKTYTKNAEPHVLAALEDCDAVVTAIGD
ncbi:MAG TPA: hypothetical protein VFG27_09080 [Pseudomonadales bacterium]|nr:hypothetical protein [Pseudomonadales bacterium]